MKTLLKIKNKSELDAWLNDRASKGHLLSGIQGPPPEGAKYNDGTLIVRQINVGWKDVTEGDGIDIEYELI